MPCFPGQSGLPAPARKIAHLTLASVHDAIAARAAACAGGRVRRNALAGAAGAVAGAAIAAVSYPVYLRFLGYERYGLWLSMSILLSVAQFGSLGLGPAVAAEVAEEHGRRNTAGIRAAISTALALAAAGGIAMSAAVLACAPAFTRALRVPPPLAPEAAALIPYLALVSLCAAPVEVMNAALAGLGRLDLSVATQVLGRAASLAVTAALLAAGAGAISLAAGMLAGYGFVCLASLRLARRIPGSAGVSARAFDLDRLRRLARVGAGVLACALLGVLVAPLNRFALARHAGPAAVSVFELAYTASLQFRAVLESGLRALMPEVSRLAGSRGPGWRGRIGKAHGRAVRRTCASGLVLFGTPFVFASPLLRAWLGGDFRPELIPATRLLLAGAFASALGVPGYYVLLGLRHVRRLVIGNMVQSAANVAALAAAGVVAGSVSAGAAASATAAGMAAGAAYLGYAASRSARPETKTEKE